MTIFSLNHAKKIHESIKLGIKIETAGCGIPASLGICMELIGIKRTPKGGKYYLAKNSWGEDNALGGYMYLSENYLRMKTIAVWMTHEAYEQKNTSKQP